VVAAAAATAGPVVVVVQLLLLELQGRHVVAERPIEVRPPMLRAAHT